MHTLLASQQEGILREPNIVADTQPEPCMLSFENRELGWPWLDEVALGEHNATWDVDVEEVLLAVRCSHSAALIEA